MKCKYNPRIIAQLPPPPPPPLVNSVTFASRVKDVSKKEKERLANSKCVCILLELLMVIFETYKSKE